MRSLAQINVEKSCCTRRQSPADKGVESARGRGWSQPDSGDGERGPNLPPLVSSLQKATLRAQSQFGGGHG